MSDTQKGWKTSEFWATLLKLCIAVGITLGVISAADATKLEGALTNVITAVFMFLANAYVVAEYVKSRTTVKTSEPTPHQRWTPRVDRRGNGTNSCSDFPSVLLEYPVVTTGAGAAPPQR